MKILGVVALAGIVLAAAPAEAQRFGFHGRSHFGVGFGLGHAPCGWACGPNLGAAVYYGPPPFPPSLNSPPE